MVDLSSLCKEFFQLIKDGQFAEAFHSATNEFQANASPEDFQGFLQDTGLDKAIDFQYGEVHEEGGMAGLQAMATLANQKKLPLLIYAKKVGNEWKIHNITPAANPITLPDLPDPASLTAVVQQYMSLFALANQQSDFTALYNLLADIWKVETTPEKLQAAFQNFIDQKINLDFVLGAVPVISEPPTLDDQGFLLVKGYYPSAERNFLFDLVFAYQHPDWKLASLNVTSHKLKPNG
jgi:hypothetical protein